jgi:hypothetical protein
MENVKDLVAMFKMALNKGMEKNKERSVVKLLTKTVSSLEAALKMMDKFLKQKDIDVGKLYGDAKTKGKSLLDQGKALVEKTKEVGIKQSAIEVGGKLKDKFKGFSERMTGPPAEGESESTSFSGELKDKAVDLKGKVAGLAPEDSVKSLLEKINGQLAKLNKTEEKKVEETSPEGNKESWFSKGKGRADKRKKEIEDEKAAVKEGAKKKPNSWLGKILSGVMALGGFLVKGISSIMNGGLSAVVKSIGFLGGFVVKGLGNTLFSLVPLLSGGIAKATGNILKTLIGGVGKGALAVTNAVGKGVLPFAGNALGVVARGAAMLATGPVGWVIAAGTVAYAGYKLYKYLNRNNVADDVYGKLTMLRLAMYGFNDTNKDYYSKLFDLEMLMKDSVKFVNYQVQITKLDKDTIGKVMELFSVSREEKDKFAIMNIWFMKRFIPAYRAYLTALWGVNNAIYLDTIDKMHDEDLEVFTNKLVIPTMIYDITDIPVFTNPKTLVTKDEVEAILTNAKALIFNKKKTQKSPATKTAEENKKAQAPQTAAPATVPPPKLNKPTGEASGPLPAPPVNTPKPDSKTTPTPDQEGEGKPPTSSSPISEVAAKVQGKLNTAQGQLTPGSTDLAGIATKLDKQNIFNLDPNVRDLFTGMAKEYNTLTGKNLNVNEAFRSYADQAALYKKMPGKAAKPGNSTHEFGLAVDVNGADVKELDRLGLLRKYGFTTSVGGEAWHLEPIGVSMNPAFSKKDVNFRDNAVASSPGRGGGGYGLLAGAKMKSRNIEYQTAIFKSNASNAIDPSKLKDVASDSSAVGAIASVSVAPKEDKVTTINSSGTSTSKPTTAPAFKDGEVTTINDRGSSTFKDLSNSVGGEGEPKPPSIPTTKTPVKSKEGVPTLDIPNNAVPVTGANIDVGKYAAMNPLEAIKQAAKVTGVNENTILSFAKLESSLNPNAKAKTSSASGLFQILDGTWKDLVKKYGAKYGIDSKSDKNNPYYNAVMGAEYLKENLAGLKGYKEAGVSEDTALYMAHFLGLGGSNKFFAQLSKDPSASIQTAVSPAQYTANKNLMAGKSVSDLLTTMDNKMTKAGGSPSTAYTGASSSKTTTASSESSLPSTPSASTPNIATSKPTTIASSSSPSPPMKASYPTPSQPSTPTIASSRINTPAAAPPPVLVGTMTAATPSKNYPEAFNSNKMEGLMSDQLDSLTKIVTLLGGMNDKLDMGKIASAISGGMKNASESTKTASSTNDRIVNRQTTSPDSVVALTRKSLST